MKINTPRLFDIKEIEDEKVREVIKPLIEYMNQSNNNIISALRSQLTLADNLKSNKYEVSVKHGIPLTLKVIDSNPVAIMLRLLHDTDYIKGYCWKVNQERSIELTIYFNDASSDVRKVIIITQSN